MRKSLKIAVAALTLSVATMNLPFASAANWARRSDDEVAASVNNAIQSNNSLYIIQWGDTLSSISRATGLSISDLAAINQISNPDLILAGAVLFFDNTNHTVTYVDQTGVQDTYYTEEASVAEEATYVEEVVEEPVYVEEVTEPEYVLEDTTEWVPEEETEEVAWEEPVVEEEPAFEEEVVEEPVVEEEPAFEEEMVEEPVAEEESAWEDEVVEEPAAEEESAWEDEVVEEPVAEEEPAWEDEVVEEPVAEEESAWEDEVVEEPVAEEELVVEEPVVEEPVVEEPVEETPADDPTAYGRAVTVEATAYSRNQPELSNFTANGTDLRVNGAVIAVDPSVIPLGSTVYVPGYGYLTAADTGGAIKGNRIDIHMEDLAAAYQFGRQTLTVYVVE